MFHNLGDVDAVVTGFREGLFSLLDVFFIDVKFLDTGVFPDVVLELRVSVGMRECSEVTGIGNGLSFNKRMRVLGGIIGTWSKTTISLPSKI